MENASKALLMAGGILIAILTITVLVMMFNKIGIFYSTEDNVASEEELSKFNLEYEAYHRDDVRGTELFSLLNKVANYNDRKSNIGEEGLSIGYEPIEIVINIREDDLRLFTADAEKPQLFKQTSYSEKGTRSTFRTQLKKELDDIINKYGETNLENLSKGLTKIFISSDDISEQQEAVYNYNKLAKTPIDNFSKINEKSQIRKDVYKYYEYVQFKRAHFNCVEIKYKDGRIVKMTFESTGKFE